MPEALDTKIEFLKGVGPAKAQALNTELGIFTVADLLSHYPFRHEDRSKIIPIIQTPEYTDIYVQLKGTIIPGEFQGTGAAMRYTATLRDETGSN